MSDAAAQISLIAEDASPAEVRSIMLGRALWILIALMASAVAIGFGLLGLQLKLLSNPTLLCLGAGYVAAVWYYRTIRGEAVLAVVMTTVGQLFLVLLLGILLTYAASAVALPYRDPQLQAIDQWLGWRRPAFLAFIESMPVVYGMLGLAYSSIMPQTLAVPLVLVLAGQLSRLQVFVLALGITLSVTAIGHVIVPAAGAYVHVDLGALEHAVALPPEVYTPFRTLEKVRSGSLSVVRLDDLEGLVAFPSFHTANAVLLAWVIWTHRILWLPILLLNGAMILSTPIGGAHYVIDLVAGAAVAAGAIAAARRLGADQPPAYTR